MNEFELQEKYQESLELERKMQIADEQLEEINLVVGQIREIDSGKENMMPLGQGVFVMNRVSSDKFLVGVGSGVFIEKSKEEAIESCERRAVALSGLKNRLQAEIVLRTEELRKIIQKTI